MIESSLVLRYRTGDASCSVRFEVNDDHLIVSFDGTGRPPQIDGEPLSALEPRAVRSGQTIVIGRRQFSIQAEPNDSTGSRTTTDIWTEEFTRWTADPSSDRAFSEPSLQDRWLKRLQTRPPSYLEAFVLAHFALIAINAALVARAETPSGFTPAFSVAIWLVTSVFAIGLSAHWDLVSAPSWLGERAKTWPKPLVLAVLFGCAHLSPGLIGFIFGSAAGFASPLADRTGMSNGPPQASAFFIRFQTAWIEGKAVQSTRDISSVAEASVPLASRPVRDLLSELSGPQLLDQICSDPISLSACYGFNSQTCRSMVNQQLATCADSTAAQGWTLVTLPGASSRYLACSVAAVSEATGVKPGARNCKEALNASIARAKARDQEFPRPLDSIPWNRFTELFVESESQHRWCGRNGLLGGCSSLLFESCRADLSALHTKCLESSRARRGDITDLNIKIAGEVINEARVCVLSEFESSYPLMKAEPICLRQRLEAQSRLEGGS
jgi:hypothetical protein